MAFVKEAFMIFGAIAHVGTMGAVAPHFSVKV